MQPSLFPHESTVIVIVVFSTPNSQQSINTAMNYIITSLYTLLLLIIKRDSNQRADI